LDNPSIVDCDSAVVYDAKSIGSFNLAGHCDCLVRLENHQVYAMLRQWESSALGFWQ
jgi:hypothetical protein